MKIKKALKKTKVHRAPKDNTRNKVIAQQVNEMCGKCWEYGWFTVML